jgi:hypothetical protein
VIELTLMSATPVYADESGHGDVIPLESVGDCTVYAQVPKRNGAFVSGVGGDTCVMVHPYITMVVTVLDIATGQRSNQGTNTCKNATDCSAESKTVPFISGHTYRTEVSAYFSSFNQYTSVDKILY